MVIILLDLVSNAWASQIFIIWGTLIPGYMTNGRILYREMTPQDVINFLRTRANKKKLALTLVAFEAAEPVGTVSLNGSVCLVKARRFYTRVASPLERLSDHPANPKWIENIKELRPKAMKPEKCMFYVMIHHGTACVIVLVWFVVVVSKWSNKTSIR